jgi:hypothetical protein
VTGRSPPATNSVSADDEALAADEAVLDADEAVLAADEAVLDAEHAPIATRAKTTTNVRRLRRITTGPDPLHGRERPAPDHVIGVESGHAQPRHSTFRLEATSAGGHAAETYVDG